MPTPNLPADAHETSDTLLNKIRHRFEEGMKSKGIPFEDTGWPAGGLPRPEWSSNENY